MSKTKGLIISECLVKALAFDTKRTEPLIYQAIMDKINWLSDSVDFKKQKVVRRQFKLNGSSISILAKFEKHQITIIPLKNKIFMSEDYTTFSKEIAEAYGSANDYVKALERRLLTV